MNTKSYVTESYSIVHPYSSIRSIENELATKEYLVVIDEDCSFHGILTVKDLIERPHKIVIDCITKKEHITTGETTSSFLNKFDRNSCFVLPLFHENKFIGVIEKRTIIERLKTKVKELHDSSLISYNVKKAFLNNLSHEVRTPLNGLIGFLEVISLLDEDKVTKNSKQYYSLVSRSADRFLQIMDNIIDLALIDSDNNLNLNKEDILIEKMFQDFADYFSTANSLHDTETSIQYTNPDPSFIFHSDKKKLMHILFHLIDIAIKFSNSKTILFGYKKRDNTIDFFITSNNTNISKKDRQEISEVFDNDVQNDNFTLRGLGIDLPLIKKLAELLGGEINFSTDELETTFICNLPLNEFQPSYN